MPSERARCFEWHPVELLSDRESSVPFGLLVLNQPLNNGVTLRRLWTNAAVRVAADGGANRLYELSSRGEFSNLQTIIGDLDSLTPSAREFFSSQPQPTTIIHDPDQYSTDFGKAINWIRKTRPELDIVAVGGIGGRIDQGLSQLHHLYVFQADAEYAAGRLYLLSDASLTFLLKAGVHRIHVREPGEQEEDLFDKYVGIIPLKEPSCITTSGLEWDVTDWATQMGGNISTSNHVLPSTKVVEVETTKDVLFTIALRRAGGDDN